MLKAATAISLFLTAFATPALAHIVISPSTAPSGSWFRADLRVPHGCEGNDTIKITVAIPKEVLIVKPQVKAGWTIQVDKKTLDKAVQGPHGPITEIVEHISWQGNLPDAYFDEFGLSMKLPDDGKRLYFPVTQECTKGRHEWKDMPEAGHGHHHGASFPAPFIEITPKQ